MNALASLFIRTFLQLHESHLELDEQKVINFHGLYAALVGSGASLEADQLASLPPAVQEKFCKVLVNTRPFESTDLPYEGSGDLRLMLSAYSTRQFRDVLEGRVTSEVNGLSLRLQTIAADILPLLGEAKYPEAFVGCNTKEEFLANLKTLKNQLGEGKKVTKDFFQSLHNNYYNLTVDLKNELKELFPGFDQFEPKKEPEEEEEEPAEFPPAKPEEPATEQDDDKEDDDFDFEDGDLDNLDDLDLEDDDLDLEPDDDEGLPDEAEEPLFKPSEEEDPVQVNGDDDEEEPIETDTGDMPAPLPIAKFDEPAVQPEEEEEEEPKDKDDDDDEEKPDSEEDVLHYSAAREDVSMDLIKDMARINDPKTGKPGPRPVEQDDADDKDKEEEPGEKNPEEPEKEKEPAKKEARRRHQKKNIREFNAGSNRQKAIDWALDNAQRDNKPRYIVSYGNRYWVERAPTSATIITVYPDGSIEANDESAKRTRKPLREGSRYASERRSNAIPKDSNWTRFAKRWDIGVLDLDNFAMEMGFRDFDDLDISISPRDLVRHSSPDVFADALRASSIDAAKADNSTIIRSANESVKRIRKSLKEDAGDMTWFVNITDLVKSASGEMMDRDQAEDLMELISSKDYWWKAYKQAVQMLKKSIRSDSRLMAKIRDEDLELVESFSADPNAPENSYSQAAAINDPKTGKSFAAEEQEGPCPTCGEDPCICPKEEEDGEEEELPPVAPAERRRRARKESAGTSRSKKKINECEDLYFSFPDGKSAEQFANTIRKDFDVSVAVENEDSDWLVTVDGWELADYVSAKLGDVAKKHSGAEAD